MREFKFFKGYTFDLIAWNNNTISTTLNQNILTYTPGTTGTYTIPIGQSYPNTGTILTTSHGTAGTITTGTYFLNTNSSTTFL